MEKQLPQSIEAEKGVLGGLLINSEAITLVADFLKPEDFYRNAHKLIYSAMLILYARHEPTDYLMVIDELERTNQLEQVDGASYLTQLIGETPDPGNVEHYGR